MRQVGRSVQCRQNRRGRTAVTWPSYCDSGMGVARVLDTEAGLRQFLRAPLGRRLELIPYLDLVPIRIRHEHVRLSGNEFPSTQDRATGVLRVAHRAVDLTRSSKTESNVGDAARGPCLPAILLEDGDVVASRRLDLNAVLVPIQDRDAEEAFVEPERPFHVANGKADMGEPISADHGSPSRRALRRCEEHEGREVLGNHVESMLYAG